MVQRRNDVADVFAHVRLHEPFRLPKLRNPVRQVRRDHPVNQPFPVRLFIVFQPVREQRERASRENPVRLPLLQLPRQVDDALPAADHVVRHEDVLPLNAVAKVFVRDDRIPPVHNPRVVPPLVEQPHVQPQHRRVEDVPVDRSLVRRNDHHVLPVNLQRPVVPQQSLENLVARHNALESRVRYRVLNPRVVRVEGDNVAHPHRHKLLQRHRAVQALPARPPVLPRFVKHRHNHRNPLRFPAHRRDNPLQVREVLVRAHRYLPPEHLVCNVVSPRVHQDIHVVSPDAFPDHAFCLTVAETGTADLDQEVLPFHAGGGSHIAGFRLFRVIPPFLQPVVDFLSDFLGSRHRDQSQRPDRVCQKRIAVPAAHEISHGVPPSTVKRTLTHTEALYFIFCRLKSEYLVVSRPFLYIFLRRGTGKAGERPLSGS